MPIVIISIITHYITIMSKKTKIISFVVLAIVLIALIIIAVSSGSNTSKRPYMNNTQGRVMSSPTDTSNQGLDQDTSVIDAQINGLNMDASNTNAI